MALIIAMASLSLLQDTIADNTNHSLAISGLSSDTTYHLQVRSTDTSGNDAISGDNTFTTVSLPEDNTPGDTDKVNNINADPKYLISTSGLDR